MGLPHCPRLRAITMVSHHEATESALHRCTGAEGAENAMIVVF